MHHPVKIWEYCTFKQCARNMRVDLRNQKLADLSLDRNFVKSQLRPCPHGPHPASDSQGTYFAFNESTGEFIASVLDAASFRQIFVVNNPLKLSSLLIPAAKNKDKIFRDLSAIAGDIVVNGIGLKEIDGEVARQARGEDPGSPPKSPDSVYAEEAEKFSFSANKIFGSSAMRAIMDQKYIGDIESELVERMRKQGDGLTASQFACFHHFLINASAFSNPLVFYLMEEMAKKKTSEIHSNIKIADSKNLAKKKIIISTPSTPKTSHLLNIEIHEFVPYRIMRIQNDALLNEPKEWLQIKYILTVNLVEALGAVHVDSSKLTVYGEHLPPQEWAELMMIFRQYF